MVGLLPLMAIAVFPPNVFEKLHKFKKRAQSFLMRHPELTANIQLPTAPGVNGRLMLSIVNEQKLRRILAIMLDETEFLSDYGIRALSRYHRDRPFVFSHAGQEFRVDYLPGDSNTGMFGGNSIGVAYLDASELPAAAIADPSIQLLWRCVYG